MQKPEPTFEEQIQKMIDNLSKRAEREVPEYGDFAIVYEEFPNTNKNFKVSDYVLQISKSLADNTGKKRKLCAVAYDLTKSYKVVNLIESGSKKEILEVLKDKDLPEKVKIIFERLPKQLEDI